MYDALTGRFTFACPSQGDARVRLSSFRRVERLPGAAHPAVFRVRFECVCGGDHDGLVAHDELDLAARLIEGGSWPWSFFCYLEERPRPVFPSSFFLLAPGERSLGIAVRCPTCETTSVNLVSHTHVDVPFHHDPQIGVVEHVFRDDLARTVEEFRHELDSWGFDARRLGLG